MKFFALLLAGIFFFTSSENVLSQIVVNETTLVSDSYTVTADGQVTITIVGADGGDGSNTNGGEGATLVATFEVNSGDVIRYVVGEAGNTHGGSSAGGGGSTGVYINNVLVMVAGAGGGGDNSGGALGLGGNTGTAGDNGGGTGPGAGGTNGNGGGATTTATASGGGGGAFSNGGSGNGGGGARSDNTTTNLGQDLSIANGGSGNGTGSAGGRGFSGGGGADANYGAGGAGYSGGGAGGSNGGGGGGGSFIHSSATSTQFTAGGDGAGSEADGSIEIFFTDDTTAPTAPQNVVANALAGGDIEISFDDVDESGSGVVSYSIKRATSTGGSYTEIGTVSDNESSSYTFTDNSVAEGTTYFYVVTAIDNATNESAESSEVSATSDATAPVFTVGTINGNPVILNYNENLDQGSVPSVNDFSIEINSNAVTISNLSYSTNQVTLTLASNVLFGDDVRVNYTPGSNPIQDETGNQSASLSNEEVTNNTPDANAPSAPPNVSATAIPGGSILINFDDQDESGLNESGVASYSVKRATSSGGSYSEVGTVTDNESNDYSFSDNTATNGVTYYYVVTAIDNGTNESVVSSEVSATADGLAPGLDSVVVDGDMLTLFYDEALDISSAPANSDYSVNVNSSNNAVSSLTISGSQVILTLSSVTQPGDNVDLSYTPGTNKIRDNVGNLASSLSNQAVTNNTLGFTPTPPQDVSATAVADGDIEISFLDVGTGGQIATYSVRRSNAQGGPYSQVGTVTDNESSNYTFTDNTSVNGNTYYYVVISLDGSSNASNNSAEVFATSDDVVPQIETTLVGGSSLLLDYDELLDANSVPSTSDFEVRVNGSQVSLSSISISNVRVNIELTNAIQQGDNVTFDYTPGSNRIRDLAGNEAAAFSGTNAINFTSTNIPFGPDPCPILNGNDASWACFDGTSNSTSISAKVGNVEIATIDAQSGTQTTFSPNALQEWSSGSFSGDEFNGPQVNATGNTGNATSFDINIADGIPSDAFIFSLNKLRPNSGNTSYTLEAFDGTNTKVALNGWITGQGVDGGVCTNSVNLNYTNGNTTLELQPTVSGNPSCTSSSNAIWFRINNTGVERIEIRKLVSQTDNIHVGLALVADYGDAPNSYRTVYNSRGNDPAFHVLSNTGTNPVYFGGTVDADGNGASGSLANGDDTESSGIGSGDDEDAITSLPVLRTNFTEYDVDLVCTSGAKVGAWLDINQNGAFDNSEYAFAECISGVASLSWGGLSGLITGDTFARFRIASQTSSVASPYGIAIGGEVEDYAVSIQEPATPDLEINKVVNNSTPIEGETIIYTISVTNPGDFEASGVQVTDELPNGVTYQSHTASQGTYNTSTDLWNIGTLAEGDTTTVTLTIVATVNNGTLGSTITNNAEITQINENDPELNNNSNSAGITVVAESSDIKVLKIVDNSVPVEGDFINYTVSVTNQGPRNATNLKIIDQLPSGVTFQSANPSVGIYNNTTGIWDIGTFVNGASASLVINVRVDQNTEGNTIANTAAVQTVDQNDPNSANNSSTASVTVTQANAPNACNDRPLLIFKNGSVESGSAGQLNAVYRFNSVLPGVYARVKIVTINNATLTEIDETSGTTEFDNSLSPRLQSSNGQNAFMDFEISFFDSVTNNSKFLSFAATSKDVDGNGNNLKEYVGFQNLSSYTVESTTDLIIGSSGIYSTYTPDNFNGVVSTDSDFSDHTVYSSYTNEPVFRFRAGITATGSTSNRLYRLSFNPCEIENFNDPVSENIIDLSISKTVDFNTPQVGDTVTYTLNAKNLKGNSVGDIEITDQIPSGLTFVSANPSYGTYTSGTGIWDIGTFSGLQTATLTLKARVNSGQEGNTITNTATYTDFTGGDGNVSNNTATADINVFDPGSGLTCNEPPLFNFNTNTLESGIGGQVNAVYRFTNIGQGLDAKVKIKAISNATLDEIDNNNLGNSAANFSPLFTATQSGGYIDWEVRFVQAGTNTPSKRSFSMTALDIDGFDNGNGGTIRDFLGFAQNESNTVQSGNNLTEGTSGQLQTFTSNISTDATGSFDIDHMAYIKYNYTSVLEFRTGSNTTGGYTDDRLVDIDFTQCRNQDFTNPVVTNRNANISVTKTVDNANPISGDEINFTITVTNNGPERATELDVRESLPAGLSLVQATPSQGTYNQLTKTWAIGTLNNGSSVTMGIEASVNSGVTADSLVNIANVIGLNQFDPSATNDTAKVAVYISNTVEGIVFRDKTGNGITDGDTNFGDASGDQTAVKDVIVHLFKDGGDGTADGNDDIYVKSDTTDISGAYKFVLSDVSDYWIAVNSKTGGLSNGTTWAEQTYATSGAVCSDGSGGSANKSSAGNCFGGRRGDQSDNLPTGSAPSGSDLANAEHITKFTLANNSISGINFGFSFNVVTNTRDGDDDGASNRSIQGSLRQFITNANTISGANTMRFVPSVATNETGSGGNWWKIILNSELPVISDPLTTLDGRSFNLNSPLSILNPNSGTVGTGGSVGIDGISLSTFERKELELDLNDVGNNALSVNSSGAVVLRHFALFNNARSVSLVNIVGGTIENNMIGTRADGTDPTGLNQSDLGILITGSGSQTPLIQRNYIAYTKDSGVRSENGNATIQFTKNEVYRAGSSVNNADGLEGIGTWSITQNLFHENGKTNGSDVYGGSGIEIGNITGTTTTGNTIRNNTIRDHKTTGINILNQVSSTLIEKNIITGNGTDYPSAPYKGAGVRLSFPDAQPQQGVYITKNSFFNNKGLAIDIVTSGNGEADGVTPNDGVIESSSVEPNRGLDYPVFTLATVDGNQLTVEGYIGKNSTRLTGVYTIEIYKAADDGNQQGLIEEGGSLIRPHGEGQTMIGTINTNANGTFSETFTVSSTSIVINDRITALTFDSGNNTSEFSTNQRVVATGVTVNGYVYKDDNHNALREGGESGIENVTIVLFNKNLNNCKSVLTDANGFYQFSNVLNGEYDLIESFGQSVPTPDVCTPAETDPTDHISTTPNLRTVIVNNLPAQQNFGDYEGSKVTGTVFTDNGIGGGTANDGIKNGTEIGINGTIVKALTGSDVLIEQTSANANGTYELFIPKSTIPSGGTVKIQEVNKASYLTIDGSSGTTSGSYDKNTDITTFTNTVGSSYTGVDFADVQVSTFNTNGSQNVLPGAIAFFQHTFEAKTAGSIVFTTNSVNNPNNVTWPVILYNDLNCNGSVESGETILDGSTPVVVTAQQTLCLLLKVSVPQGLNNGSTSNTTISAVMSYSNTSPVIEQNLSRSDLVTVNNNEAGLVLIKTVDQNQALPGATLTYTVSYQNNGDEPISSLEIIDNTPNYTTFNTATCGSLPNNLTDCTITSPSVGTAGGIKWTFTGTLQPGGTGVVTFTVKIDN